ncbi:MAG: hypothetical protein KJ607_13715, partial [Bacteroidetes bacterium]|nr:hypothetical protein [Bacteroidota bacterium]
SIPGGGSSTVPLIGGLVVENSGLDVDDCGNVYAGSGSRIVKYDADLNYIAEAAVSFTVYDVSVNSNGEVVAVGAAYDNSYASRSGGVQSVNLSACDQFALTCCDANICPIDDMCDTDSPVTFLASTPGGTWSGPGINPVTGVFDPSVAGVGTHTITYTLPCGSDSTVVIVDPCVPIDVCYDGTNLIATGGTGTIIWEDWEDISTPINNEQECIDCPFTNPIYIMGFYVDCSSSTCSGVGWIQFGTGSTVAPPSYWPMQVSDDNGVAVTYNSLSEIPSCSACTNPVLSTAVTNVSCTGGNDGAIDLTVTGSSTYNVQWSDSQTTQDISGLSAGSYTVTVTDAVNPACSATTSVVVNDGSSGPAPSISGNLSFCSGSSSTLDAGAGYSSYLWSTGSSAQTITVTTTGQYIVTVSDVNGCTGSDAVSVSVTGLPAADAGQDQNVCEGYSATLVASGGTSYLWSTGAANQSITVTPPSTTTYYVTVTQNGCSASDSVTVTVSQSLTAEITATVPTVCTGQSTQLTASGGTSYYWNTGQTAQTITVTPLAPTVYSVTVSDVSGCTGTDQIQIDVSDTLTVIVAPPTICTGESAVLTSSAGDTYIWSTGDTIQSITVTPLSTTVYYVTVTAGGCTGSTDVTVTVNDIPTANAGTDQQICSGEQAILTASGGTSYLWNTGASTASVTVSPTTTTSYNVTVTQNGCSATDDVTVTVAPTPVADAGEDQYLCEGETVTLTASGGTSFLWSDSTTSQSITVAPTATTDYMVTVYNSGCSATDSVTVTVSSVPIADAGMDQDICSGAGATLTASGGSSYYWSTQSTGASVTVSPSQTTTYYVTVTESFCDAVDSVTVNVGAAVTPGITASPSVVCETQSSLLTASGGTSYLWSTGATTDTITVTPPSTTVYYVTVYDAECSATTNIMITVNPGITATSTPTEICAGESAVLTVSSGDTYIWDNGATTQNITVSPTSTTIYSVTVTAGTCTDSTDVVVTVNALPVANAGADHEICEGGFASLSA